LAAHSGHILDFSKISAKAKVSRSSCTRCVEILEDTLIAQRVSIFDEATNANVIQHPKLYFFDVGVLNGLLNNFTVSEDRKGLLFEHLLCSQIRNSATAKDLPCEITYFRTRHGIEVDFIVKLKGKVWAIEVKTGDVAATDLKGLKAFEIKQTSILRQDDFIGLKLFKEDFPEAQCFLLSFVSEEQVYNDIHIIPFEKALWHLAKLMGFRTTFNEF
jgi:predicted AAA+ superfamily ATPase